MATLRLDGLKKTYPNGFVALHGLDLEIADGELLVVVGPSGCGKSTLLRMLAGLEDITAGDLYIGEARVNPLEPADRDIAMVFQNYALYPHMSVAGNMEYALKNRGVPKEARRRKVEETASLIGLQDLLDRRPRQLSGGQRQRVAMGRAIVREPQVFLFDEPLSNLDAKLRVQMRLEIRRLQKRLGVTSVYVTHDQVEAMTLADRLIVMNEGRIEQLGSPMTLYDQPASTFVAGFIGSPAMNFLSAEASGRTLSLPCGNQLHAPVDAHGHVTLGIRPEHLVPVEESDDALAVQVELVEPLGADTLAYVQLDGQAEPLVVRFDGARRLEEGDRLWLAPDLERLHLFDPEQGQRLTTTEAITTP
ncbi:sn-glycerol-3-phosphate import ATP-binding protein UgpC [Aidingimonas halophila]|uniref:Carbohydrate ABC transporter ATP-binding protein, CUT1 family n=1 Tax=Aidingimonas halophila TaxID=574349 RepID=A0A1H3EZ73_9GAMM|nr:sn-glycerol-3-phosphate import ATP-binding protein UgpC [Aidingimonas halophila]GHC31909.1 sn-glycerol-3-phosphate import ATP-binding protein UgpC [Aidingimonas halophila]SDX83358.1 carbohydrate ABC transporter ATP-binding protein, CUT1 family [Aidingimonas halophila]